MGIDDPEHQRILSLFQEHLLKHMPEPRCPVCSNRAFAIAVTVLLENFTITASAEKTSLNRPAGAVPAGTVTCKRCGYVYLIDLIVAGIWHVE